VSPTVSLELRNDRGELSRVAQWVEQLATELGLVASVAYRVDLCLAELVTNVVDYGYDDDAEHAVVLRARRIGRTVVVDLEDDGRPFNPLEAPPPPEPTSLEDAPIGGLGLQLVRANVDGCRYRREDGKNVLTMSFEERATVPASA
jgi:serine/threonine-protein kinase RsbW